MFIFFLATYHIILDVRNFGSQQALVQWKLGGMAKELMVDPFYIKSESIEIQSPVQPDPIMFSIVDAVSDQPIEVKGQREFYITPTLQKKKTVIEFGQGEGNPCLHIKCSSSRTLG